MSDTIASLRRKVGRLEERLEEAKAERDLAEMMMHDLAPDAIVSFIERKYPAMAKKWVK